MKFALFSDVHGHLRIVLHMIRCWQMDNKEFLDGAFIAGDLGCFPEENKIDGVTNKWLEQDPEEAGFSKYFVEPDKSVQKMIQGGEELGHYSEVKCPVLFVAGNHEDFEYLKRKSSQPARSDAPPNTFCVDCYKKFFCIRDGEITKISGENGNSFRVGGLWGIEKAKENAPYRLEESAVQSLINHSNGNYQLLLTHEAPSAVFSNDWGSDLVDRIIRRERPSFHLFGHVEPQNGKHIYLHPEADTNCILFHDVGFGKNMTGTLEGSMGILDWSGSSGKIEIVDEFWLNSMMHQTWKEITPDRM